MTSLRRHGRPVALLVTPSAELYGSDRMLVETVAALVQADWNVVVAVPESGPLTERVRQLGADVVICPTARVRKSALRPAGIARLTVEFLGSLRPSWRLTRATKPDVVYVNTVTVPTWLLLARLLRIPSICHVHEGEANASRLLLRLVNMPLFLADSILINSRFSRDVLERASGVLARRSRVIYNAVAGPEEVAAPRARLEGHCRVLFVGRLIPRKGPQVALDAVARLREQGRDVILDMVGAPFREYRWFERDLQDRVDRLGVDDAVMFHGFDSDIWPHLARCDVAVVPSTMPEPFGNTAVEAALAARPRVVSDFPGLREATRDMQAAHLVAPDDASALADGIAAIIDSWDEARAGALTDARTAQRLYAGGLYASEIVTSFNEVRAASNA